MRDITPENGILWEESSSNVRKHVEKITQGKEWGTEEKKKKPNFSKTSVSTRDKKSSENQDKRSRMREWTSTRKYHELRRWKVRESARNEWEKNYEHLFSSSWSHLSLSLLSNIIYSFSFGPNSAHLDEIKMNNFF